VASPGAPGWRIGTSDKLIEGITRKLTKVKTDSALNRRTLIVVFKGSLLVKKLYTLF
jgi:hypothetical protein